MLIDIDHMSQAAADQTLSLACYGDWTRVPPLWGPSSLPCSFGYPVNSGHNAVRGFFSTNRNERALRRDQYWLIGRLHGMAGVGSENLDAEWWLSLYNTVHQAMCTDDPTVLATTSPRCGGGSIVAGLGTDTNGFALGMPPRPGIAGTVREGPDYTKYQLCIQDCEDKCPDNLRTNALSGTCMNSCTRKKCNKQFPEAFVNVPAVPGSSIQYSSGFPPSRGGTKTWDYNKEGVAHYGMLWEFLQDVRSLAGGAAMVDNNFMFGADYLFHTWQIAEAKSAQVK
jgi:hypothetical protein